MHVTSLAPWHEGERALQREAGISDDPSVRMGLTVRDHLHDQQRRFFPQLPFVFLGTVDAGGAPWATLLASAPGFLSIPYDHTFHVARTRLLDHPAEPGSREGSAAILLGIDKDARRRTRLNGRLRRVDGPGALTISDYPGNNYYDTLGHLRLDGRAGSPFVDFATGGVLQLTGWVTIGAALPDPAAVQSRRPWTVRPERIVLQPGALLLRRQDA
jgi:predicted pyridoxine 5'-phosphate oxidase superfamily flavin-nucleotide-binding protein